MDVSSTLSQVPLPPGFGTARGSEHEVWLDSGKNIVIKATHPGEFGRLFGPRPFASLQEYLARVNLTQEVFGIDWQVIGIHGKGKRMRVVTTQPVIRGAAATLVEIHDFMKLRGFLLFNTRFGDAWFRQEDHLLVSDAEPKNVLSTAEGLVPIDVIVSRPDKEFLKLVNIIG